MLKLNRQLILIFYQYQFIQLFMESITQKLWTIRQNLFTQLTPITWEEIQDICNKKNKNCSQINSNQIQTNQSQKIQYSLSPQQNNLINSLTKDQNNQQDFENQKQFEQQLIQNTLQNYSLNGNNVQQLMDKSHTIDRVRLNILTKFVEPLHNQILLEFKEETINQKIIKIHETKTSLKYLKDRLLTKNQDIFKLLNRKSNITKYLIALKQIKKNTNHIVNTSSTHSPQNSIQKIENVIDQLQNNNQELVNYKFYPTLLESLNVKISSFYQLVQNKLVECIDNFDENDIIEMSLIYSKLSKLEKQNIIYLILKSFKQILKFTLEKIIVKYIKLESQVTFTTMFHKIPKQNTSSFICSFFKEVQSKLTNMNKIKYMLMINFSEMEKEIQKLVGTYVLVIVQELAEVLFNPLVQDIYIFQIIEYFLTGIIQSQKQWETIKMMIELYLKQKNSETLNLIETDIKSETWKLKQFKISNRLEFIKKYVCNNGQTYNQRIEWILNKKYLEYNNFQKKCGSKKLVYSSYNFVRYLENVCFQLVVFHQFLFDLILQNYIQLLQFYIHHLIHIFVTKIHFTETEYNIKSFWKKFPKTYRYLKQKNLTKNTNNCPQEEWNQQKIHAVCSSINLINSIITKQSELIVYLIQQKDGRQYFKQLELISCILNELPELIMQSYIETLLRSIQLKQMKHKQWINKEQLELTQFISSIKLNYSKLKIQSFQINFSNKIQLLFIDTVCLYKKLSIEDWMRILEKYSMLNREFEKMQLFVTKQVPIFLNAIMSEDEDLKMKLLYQKKYIYSFEGLVQLHPSKKNKKQLKQFEKQMKEIGQAFFN